MDKIIVYVFLFTYVVLTFVTQGTQSYEVCRRTDFEIQLYCDDGSYCCSDNQECCSNLLNPDAKLGVVFGCLIAAAVIIMIIIACVKHTQHKRGKAMMIKD
ncbi:hypothetical protein ACF0H5_017206 [Mactra antiquata]